MLKKENRILTNLFSMVAGRSSYKADLLMACAMSGGVLLDQCLKFLGYDTPLTFQHSLAMIGTSSIFGAFGLLKQHKKIKNLEAICKNLENHKELLGCQSDWLSTLYKIHEVQKNRINTMQGMSIDLEKIETYDDIYTRLVKHAKVDECTKDGEREGYLPRIDISDKEFEALTSVLTLMQAEIELNSPPQGGLARQSDHHEIH